MGIDELLETVILTAEMRGAQGQPEPRGQGLRHRSTARQGPRPDRNAARPERHAAAVGDLIIAGTAVGRVRVMTNDKGAQVKEAGPSVPVEITGLAEVPAPGDEFNVVDDETHGAPARRAAQAEDQGRRQSSSTRRSRSRTCSAKLAGGRDEGAEPSSSRQTCRARPRPSRPSLEKLSNEEVRVRVIHAGVGAINESDIMLASTSNAIVIGFNVRPDTSWRRPPRSATRSICGCTASSTTPSTRSPTP